MPRAAEEEFRRICFVFKFHLPSTSLSGVQCGGIPWEYLFSGRKCVGILGNWCTTVEGDCSTRTSVGGNCIQKRASPRMYRSTQSRPSRAPDFTGHQSRQAADPGACFLAQDLSDILLMLT
uniref:Uncharacterized protein n=1 Tax=Hyaloperonospora arabidopsidis (strain Emoy2) TaxID=559515 RepID=M4BLI2_HYAAE